MTKLSPLQIWSAYFGNFFQHYDGALFSFLSPFLAPLFFPNADPITALILTYAMSPLGMIARPFGSLVFGWIGDQHGRQKALFYALLGMAIVTGSMALCPTFEQVGFFAPALFCLGRLLQNFLAAGETMGGAIFILENTEEKKHDFHSALYTSSKMGGVLLAGAAVGILGYFQVVQESWRWLYAFGFFTAISSAMLRSKLPSTAPKKGFSTSLKETGQIFWTYRTALVKILFCSGFTYTTYVIALVLMNGFIPLITPFSKAEMSTLNTFLLIFDFACIPVFGWISSRIGRENLMVGASIFLAITTIPLFALLDGASFINIIAIRTILVMVGVGFAAPFHAWSNNLVPPEHRYLILSFGYALGSQLVGGPTAALSLWLFKYTGIVSSAAWYASILALICGFIVYQSKKITQRNLEPVKI